MINSIRTVARETSKILMKKMRRGPRGPRKSVSIIFNPVPRGRCRTVKTGAGSRGGSTYKAP
jgi:hypothetical protein